LDENSKENKYVTAIDQKIKEVKEFIEENSLTGFEEN
jgi:hypothetical protein